MVVSAIVSRTLGMLWSYRCLGETVSISLRKAPYDQALAGPNGIPIYFDGPPRPVIPLSLLNTPSSNHQSRIWSPPHSPLMHVPAVFALLLVSASWGVAAPVGEKVPRDAAANVQVCVEQYLKDFNGASLNECIQTALHDQGFAF